MTFIEIKETGKEEKIEVLDPKTRIDWSGDLIGNHSPEIEGYNDDGCMIMTQDTFDWWADYCNKYEVADQAVSDLLSEKDDLELSELYHDFICGIEFNEIPEAMMIFVKEHND